MDQELGKTLMLAKRYRCCQGRHTVATRLVDLYHFVRQQKLNALGAAAGVLFGIAGSVEGGDTLAVYLVDLHTGMRQ